MSSIIHPSIPLTAFIRKANILIDQAGHARLADFGLFTITPDPTNTTSSNSFPEGGTWRWMSPEFFNPAKFKLKDNRQTERSDCYALGMVVYEVLSGRLPFSQHHGLAVIGNIIDGKRPRRPRGQGGRRFTDDVWGVLDHCWKPNPWDRPSIKDVLQCLEGASRSWMPPSPRMTTDQPTTNLPARDSDPSSEETTDESEAPSPSRTVPSQPLLEHPRKGNPDEISICPFTHKFSAFPDGAPDYKDLETGVINPDGSDSEESQGISDRVSWTGFPTGSGVELAAH